VPGGLHIRRAPRPATHWIRRRRPGHSLLGCEQRRCLPLQTGALSADCYRRCRCHVGLPPLPPNLRCLRHDAYLQVHSPPHLMPTVLPHQPLLVQNFTCLCHKCHEPASARRRVLQACADRLCDCRPLAATLQCRAAWRRYAGCSDAEPCRQLHASAREADRHPSMTAFAGGPATQPAP